MNKNSSQGYIELNRKYAKFQDYHLFSKPESIDVVLKENDAVVILGDKGSGKTTEIKQFQHRKHRDNSIYFDLKDIYSGFQDVKSRIESLIKSLDLRNDGSYLYLLFDSIDECRLQGNRQQDAFETALQKIKNDLANQSTHISKIKFIFTSREAGWKKNTDENLIKEYLSSINPLKQKSDTTNNTMDVEKYSVKINVYTLEKLDNDQKRLIANHFSENEDFFEKDVIAQEYSDTPLDCVEFLKFKKRRRNTTYKMEGFSSL